MLRKISNNLNKTMRRFFVENETVLDTQTGLMWTKNASLSDFPLSWDAAFNTLKELNLAGLYGYKDWKLPNRRELFSLISHKRINPSLPASHPFTNVFTGYYWTSSSCARLPNQAWYIHLGGARVYRGMKYGSYMVWPVRVAKDNNKSQMFQTGQDGKFQPGLNGHKHRFTENKHFVYDNSTALTWLKNANISNGTLDWKSAFEAVLQLNSERKHHYNDWRLPNIVELETLTDLDQHSPALPVDHLFNDVQEFYWSYTTSRYDTHYAWVLYAVDGAIGVGYKPLSEFYLWPVRGNEIHVF